MNALIPIETLTPAVVFAPGGVEEIVSKLETEVRAIPRDMTTEEGREAIRALAYKVARSKTALDDMGKELVAGIKKQSGAIDAERRTIRDRLDALRDEVRGPLTAWEDAEKDRVDGHERALVWIIESPRFATPPTVAMICAQIDDLAQLALRDWEEFHERAEAAIRDAYAALHPMLAAAEQAERDASELAELRQMKADREAADNAAAAAANAAADARIHAEQQRARDAERAEQEKAREIARAEQAEKDKAAAVAKAIEDERQRAAAKEAASKAAIAKLMENKRHRTKIHREAAEAILALILNEECAVAGHLTSVICEAIAAGKVPHVSITY
jgi:colicin import membrane protein